MSATKIAHTLWDQKRCCLCPHNCNADRSNGRAGYCQGSSGYSISSISIHHGEEPAISGTNGICNVFFQHCNLQCLYCQNYQISLKSCDNIGRELTLDNVLQRIIAFLEQGIENLGFVSPSHMVYQVRSIVEALHKRGYHPIIVYNTNAYERVEVLRSLEDIVDVYIPDFKYMDNVLAQRWSGARNYPEIAGKAIKEMYRQRGNVLSYNSAGKLENGLIVRHLVLPGAVDNSIDVLRFLAWEISPNIAISLMSQYQPTPHVASIHPLNRRINPVEYNQVVNEMEKLGFSRGWTQQLNSADYYNPDFTHKNPFV